MAQWLLAFLFNGYLFVVNSQCGSSTWDAWYTGDSFHELSGNWGDGVGGHINVFGLQQHQGAEINGKMYITGTTSHSFTIGPIIGYNNYTIFHVARFADAALYRRIFTSATGDATNWASGFQGGHFKTAFHGGWVAPRNNPANSIDWIISTDSLNIYRANGQDLTVAKGSASIKQITVNKYDGESSNFAIAELIIINGETKSESYMQCVEQYLSNKYNIPLYTIHPTKSPSTSPTDSTNIPTNNPTNSPTKNPTNNPSIPPTKYPTSITNNPTRNPSRFPTFNPSKFPSNIPTFNDFNPTKVPSASPTTANEYGITDDNINNGQVIESTNVLFVNKVSESEGMSATIIGVAVIVPLFICFILIGCGVCFAYKINKINKNKKYKSESKFIATDTNRNTNEQTHIEMDGDMIITGDNETNGQELMDDFVVETKGNGNEDVYDDDDDVLIVDDVNETHGKLQNDSGNENVRNSFVVDDETAKPNDDSASGSDQLVVNDINEMQTLQ